jgi:ribose-phosphate pyrophosphokinase
VDGKDFALAVPHYEEIGAKGPYFGDLVWKYLTEQRKVTDFEYVPIRVDPFPDRSEKAIVQENVREKVVFVIHTPYLPPAQHVMLGAEMADAVKRSDSREVYFVELFNSYFRQDARADREPVTARLVADFYHLAGVDGVFTADPHAKQLAGFFKKLEPLPMTKRITERIRQKYDITNAVAVAPDHGGFQRSEDFANMLGIPLVVIHKERKGEETTVKAVIGDVRGKDCFIRDDILGTGTTMKNDALALRKYGARKVYAVATHLGMYRDAKRLMRDNDIEVIGTNSLPLSLTDEDRKYIYVVDISDIIGEVIQTKAHRGSLRKYFKGK